MASYGKIAFDLAPVVDSERRTMRIQREPMAEAYGGRRNEKGDLICSVGCVSQDRAKTALYSIDAAAAAAAAGTGCSRKSVAVGSTADVVSSEN
jgi:hypothetical protein